MRPWRPLTFWFHIVTADWIISLDNFEALLCVSIVRYLVFWFMHSFLSYVPKHEGHRSKVKGMTEFLSWSYDAISQKIVPHSNIFSSTWATTSIFHFKWVLPFPIKIHPIKIFTRATPGISLVVSNKAYT